MKKVTKILCLVLAILMLTSTLVACSSSGGKTEKKTITMATNAYFPPYEYYEGTEIVGIDVDIMAAVCKHMGCEFKIEDMEFDAIINAVDSGKADVGMSGMTVTEKRLESVDFSIPYTKSKQVIVVPVGSTIAGPDDLDAKKIGVQLGTTADLYLTLDKEDGIYSEATDIQQYNTFVEAIEALLQGKLDAVVVDQEPGKVFVEQNEGLMLLETEYIEEEYAICIKKGNTELLNAVNAALEELKANGELQKIIDKWIPAA